MSLFEIMMLVCFGAAWPFSIWKSWKGRTTAGKSVVFLWIILAGYLAGIAHKILYSRDAVILFYAVNALMVAADLALWYRNRRLASAAGA
jgi:hypothetical protein